jgi:hypothetical protein
MEAGKRRGTWGGYSLAHLQLRLYSKCQLYLAAPHYSSTSWSARPEDELINSMKRMKH